MDMSLKAQADKQSFKWDKLRRIESVKTVQDSHSNDAKAPAAKEESTDRFDACTYTISSPTAKITFGDLMKVKGKIDITIQKLENVEISIIGLPAGSESKGN